MMGDPEHTRKGLRARNEVRIKTEEEVIELIHKGYALWVETGTRPSMVKKNLFIDDKQIT